MKYIFLIAMLLLSNAETGYCLDKVNEAFLKYVNKSSFEFQDIQQLHDYLIKPAKTKRERAELFFYWIAQHVAYDVNNFTVSGEKVRRYDVLKERKGVCRDYSEFFKLLCDLSEIECHFVAGYIKIPEDKLGEHLKISHAWNVIKLDNEYEFVDCTWGSGMLGTDSSEGNSKYVKDIAISQVFVSAGFRLGSSGCRHQIFVYLRTDKYQNYAQLCVQKITAVSTTYIGNVVLNHI